MVQWTAMAIAALAEDVSLSEQLGELLCCEALTAVSRSLLPFKLL